MTAKKFRHPAPFRLIRGGKPTAGPVGMSRAPRPDLDAASLAVEMGRILALSLLRDTPLADLSDPHRAVRIGAGTAFSLNDLDTELRRVARSAGRTDPSGAAASVTWRLSRLGHTDPDGAAVDGGWAIRDDGPSGLLDLANLAALGRPAAWGGGAMPGGDTATKADDLTLSELDLPGLETPTARHSFARWLPWIEAVCGARLRPVRGHDPADGGALTLGDLAVRVHDCHPCRIYFQTALHLLAEGRRSDCAPSDGSAGWGRDAPRVLALLLRGARAARDLRRRSARVARPGVIAARWSLMLMDEDLSADPDAVRDRAALERLSSAAPRLLDWVALMNNARGTGGFALPSRAGDSRDGWSPMAFDRNLMMPPLRGATGPVCPSLGAGRAVLAGTMVTLLKAVFAGSDPQSAADPDIGAQFDRLAQAVTVGRSVAGGFYAAENDQSLRLGQSLALHLLRSELESAGAPATLDLRDLDGRAVTLVARRTHAGAVSVQMRLDGAHAPWPSCREARQSPLLRAVV